MWTKVWAFAKIWKGTVRGSKTFSFFGLLVSTSSVLRHVQRPDDALLLWLARACYLLDVRGIAFHALLLIVSCLLEFGALSEIPPLLLPWLAGSPFLVTAVVVQMILVTVQQPDVSLPVAVFCLTIVLSVVYASLAVSAYYRRMHRDAGNVRLRIFDLGEGQLPRVVEVPRPVSFRTKDGGEVLLLQPPTVGSTARASQRLSDAYARFVSAAAAADRREDVGPTRF